jgi:hypothetical protein
MQFGNDNGMALSRQHIAALEKDARRMRKRRFSLSRCEQKETAVSAKGDSL